MGVILERYVSQRTREEGTERQDQTSAEPRTPQRSQAQPRGHARLPGVGRGGGQPAGLGSFRLFKTEQCLELHISGACACVPCVRWGEGDHTERSEVSFLFFLFVLIFRALLHYGCEATKSGFKLSRTCRERESGEDSL